MFGCCCSFRSFPILCLVITHTHGSLYQYHCHIPAKPCGMTVVVVYYGEIRHENSTNDFAFHKAIAVPCNSMYVWYVFSLLYSNENLHNSSIIVENTWSPKHLSEPDCVRVCVWCITIIITLNYSFQDLPSCTFPFTAEYGLSAKRTRMFHMNYQQNYRCNDKLKVLNFSNNCLIET